MPSIARRSEDLGRRAVAAPVTAPAARSAPAAGPAAQRDQRIAAEIDADVEVIAQRLKEQVLTAAEEREVVAVIRRWASTPSFDRFVGRLRLRVLTRATARSLWQDTSVNLFDTLFHELEDDRLVEFQQLLATSRRYAGATPESGPSENAAATIGRQELIGMFGMMKGLSSGLAGVGDVAVWAAVKQTNLYLAPFGLSVKDPGKFAEWVEEQLDVSGDYLFDGGFTGGEELFAGQNAASIGKRGGSVIWNLVMLHGGAGAGSVASSGAGTAASGIGAALKVHDLVGAFKEVDDALASMGDYLVRMQDAGKLDRDHLLRDDQFKVEAFRIAGALTGAVGQALGLGGEDFAQAVQKAMDTLGSLFKAGEITAKLGRISQILMDDSLPPAQQRKEVGDAVMDLVAEAFSALGARAAKVDRARRETPLVARAERRASERSSDERAPEQQPERAPDEPEQAPERVPERVPDELVRVPDSPERAPDEAERMAPVEPERVPEQQPERAPVEPERVPESTAIPPGSQQGDEQMQVPGVRRLDQVTTEPEPVTTAPKKAGVAPAKARQRTPEEVAFRGRFSHDTSLNTLWDQASAGVTTFPKARANFWRLVNEGSGEHVERVRRVLDAAGYERQGGARAPLLRMSGWDARKGRELSDRVLTIDHIKAQSSAKGAALALKATNLRFMTGRDNATRGNSYTVRDRPEGGWKAYRKRRAKRVKRERQAWEADLRTRVENLKKSRKP